MTFEEYSEDLLKRFHAVQEDRFVYLPCSHDGYIKFLCNNGHLVEQYVYSHLKGIGCGKCANIKRGESQRKTTESFVLEAEKIFGGLYNYSKVEYKTAYTKVEISCKNGHTFFQNPHGHLTKRGCPECAQPLLKMTDAEFQEKSRETHKNRYEYDSGSFRGASLPARIVCKEHGEFFQRPFYHLRGGGCPACAIKNNPGSSKMGFKEVVRRANISHDNKFSYIEHPHPEKITAICEKHGKFETLIGNHINRRSGCPSCSCSGKSHAETEITEYLQTVGITPKNNDRSTLEGFELDLLIPEHNLAIEYDGMYWHGYKLLRKHNPDESTASISKRHVNKTNQCEEKGITLYHIFENEWQNPLKRSIWKSMLRSAVGKSKRIYARKCSIMEIDNKTAGEFLDENHLQGSVNAMFRLALVHDDETVAIMTFGVSRYSKEYKYELLRMCNKKGITVVGGFSRLLKAFRRSHEGSIVSYANRRFSTGNVYEKNGFTPQRISPPCYWYFNSDNDTGLVHRSTFMKHKLNNVLDKFDPDLTEWENMAGNGWDKIYDCGNLIYGLT